MPVRRDTEVDLPPTEAAGPGDAVKVKYDAMIQGTAKSGWRSLVNFSNGGFIKGLAIAALAFTASWALGAGVMAAAGALTVNGLALVTFEAGFAAGLTNAIGLLTTSMVGIGILVGGGLIGAKMESDKVRAKLTPEQAQQRSRFYEEERARQQEQQYQPSMPKAAEAEKDKEAAPASPSQDAQQHPMYDSQLDAGSKKSFCACEDVRRAQNKNMNQERPSYGR